MDGGAGSAPSQKRPLPPDGDLVELLWRNGAVVTHSQSQGHHHQRAVGCGPSGVTGEEEEWLPDGGALGGDVYAQLWRSISQLDGRVDGDTAAWPPATSGAGSSRTGGEVGSSFCGSSMMEPAAAPALHVGDDAALPLPGASSSGRSGSSVLLKRARDEFDSRSEDAEFDNVDDDARPSRRPASSKRRTRSAEVHNLSERRRRDRINEKMRALQELVPHCNKSDKASILDEAIEYLKSLQMQVQIMWMTTGMAPLMLPGAHQLMSPMGMGLNSPPTTQVLSQMQRVPPFLNNPLPNQMPRVSSAATTVPNAANLVQKNPFLHPNDALAAAPEVPSLFGYGSQMAQRNEIQELLAGAAAPSLGAEHPSSSDGTGTT